ncbi:unnamed protein product [Schistocephalus solidus]|uniref:Uncharacterized protein n=1 Tax=Schistocephalus solidus TaxID=70667 RepID=A0A183SRR3_SCHSO|nr:unnamed protein product [Schistocephalus solidus]
MRPTGSPPSRPFQRAHAANAHSACAQCNDNPTTSTFSTTASDPKMMTTLTTDTHFIDASSPTITNAILPPPPPGPIMATINTCPTPATTEANADYLPPATSSTRARLVRERFTCC